MLFQKITEALRCVCRETYIFVHVESIYAGKIDILFKQRRKEFVL